MFVEEDELEDELPHPPSRGGILLNVFLAVTLGVGGAYQISQGVSLPEDVKAQVTQQAIQKEIKAQLSATSRELTMPGSPVIRAFETAGGGNKTYQYDITLSEQAVNKRIVAGIKGEEGRMFFTGGILVLLAGAAMFEMRDRLKKMAEEKPGTSAGDPPAPSV